MTLSITQIPFVASTQSAGSASGKSSYSLVIPSTVVPGDLILLQVDNLSANGPSATPAGFTAGQNVVLGAQQRMDAYYKVVVAGDAGSTVTVAYATGQRAVLNGFVVSGSDGSVIAGVGSAPTASTSVTAVPGQPYTSPAAGDMVIQMIGLRVSTAGLQASFNTDPAWTKVADNSNTSTTLVNINATTFAQIINDTSAHTAPTFTSSQAGTWMSLDFYLTPAPVVVVPPPAQSGRIPGQPILSLWTGQGNKGIRLQAAGMVRDGRVYPPHYQVTQQTYVDPNPSTDGNAFAPSGIDGAGYQNYAMFSPYTIPANAAVEPNARPLLVFADVAGAHRSVDKGATYLPCNVAKNLANQTTQLPTNIAGGMWSQATPGKAYCITGKTYNALQKGLYVTTDWGRSWKQKGMLVSAAANGKEPAIEIDGKEHPRHTGRLIAQSDDGATLWVANTTGIAMSQDDGATTAATFLPTDHVKSVMVDPNNNTILYAAVHNDSTGTVSHNGVWKITAADTVNPVATQLGSWPFARGAEEMYVDSSGATTNVFAVAHSNGACVYTEGQDWKVLNAGLDVVTGLAAFTIEYQAITGIRVGGNLRLAVGGSAYGARNNRYIWYGDYTDAGRSITWTCATDSRLVDNRNIGETSNSFISKIGYQTFTHGSDWSVSALEFDPDAPDNLFSIGRGGLWRGTKPASGPGGIWNWRVSTAGLMVTVNMFVEADTSNGDQVAIGSMDYTVLTSANGGLDFDTSGGVQSANPKSPGANSTGDCGCFDQFPVAGVPAAFVLGASLRGAPTQDAANGVYFNADLFGSGTWNYNDYAFPDGSIWRPGGKTWDVPSITLGRNAPGGTYVILALVTKVGFAYKLGTGAWQAITDLPAGLTDASDAAIRPNASFSWHPTQPTVFVHARDGIYRSTQYGKPGSWTKIYATTSTGYGRYNTLRVDRNDPTKVYVSLGGGGLIRIDNALATTGTAATNTTLLTGDSMGTVTYDRGTGYLYGHVPGSGKLYRWTAPSTSTAFTDVSDQFFRDNSRSIRATGITLNGVMLTADNGQGSIRGNLRTTTNPTPPTPPAAVSAFVPGKILVGGVNSTNGVGHTYQEWDTMLAGHFPISRVYSQSLDITGSPLTQTQNLIAAGKGVFLSLLPDLNAAGNYAISWADIGNPDRTGANQKTVDARLLATANALKAIPNYKGKIVLTFNHEPENDGTGPGNKDVQGTGAAAIQLRADYRQAAWYVAQFMKTQGVVFEYGVIYISDTFKSTTKNYIDYSPDIDSAGNLRPAAQRVLTYLGWDPYAPKISGAIDATSRNKTFAELMKEANDAQAAAVAAGKQATTLPIAIGEFGLLDAGATSPQDGFVTPATLDDNGVTTQQIITDMVNNGPSLGLLWVNMWSSGDYKYNSTDLRAVTLRNLAANPPSTMIMLP